MLPGNAVMLQARLSQELKDRGITQFSLVRVPANYYEVQHPTILLLHAQARSSL